RPYEMSALKTLGKQTQSVATPPQDLYPIPRTSPENKELTGKRIFGELCLHERGKAIETLAHVGRPGREPHLHTCRQCNHRRTRTSITRARHFGSIGPCTTMLWPLASLISMLAAGGPIL